MGYFSTMNLPAPPHGRFLEFLRKYENMPREAVATFEEALRTFFQVEGVATMSNCFTALSIALLFATRGRARTVAIAGLAYRRTVDIVLWAGLRPVCVDTSPETLAMSLDDLRRKADRQAIGCVMVQHPMVNICDVDAYLAFGREYAIPIVFDSVEATGGSYKGKKVGGFGLVEGFSLHPSKVLNGAEGGVLTFGRRGHYDEFLGFIDEIGVRDGRDGRQRLFGLEPLHAIMGLASLTIYEEARSRFREQYLRYRKNLGSSRILELVEYDVESDPNFKSILVRMRGALVGQRARLLENLEKFNIGARAYYAPLHTAISSADAPNASALAGSYAILPTGYSVSLSDIDFICDKIAEFENSMD